MVIAIGNFDSVNNLTRPIKAILDYFYGYWKKEHFPLKIASIITSSCHASFLKPHGMHASFLKPHGMHPFLTTTIK